MPYVLNSAKANKYSGANCCKTHHWPNPPARFVKNALRTGRLEGVGTARGRDWRATRARQTGGPTDGAQLMERKWGAATRASEATGASQLWFRHVSFYPTFSVMKIVRHCGSDHRGFRKMLTHCPRNERSSNRDGNEALASILTNKYSTQLGALERIANRHLAMANSRSIAASPSKNRFLSQRLLGKHGEEAWGHP